MGVAAKDDGWRISDKPWQQIEPLLSPRKPHPLGCHNPRVPDRKAMNAIFFVLRTGLPLERPERHRHLLLQLGIPALSGMDGRQGVRVPLEKGAHGP
jgi:hypothetical protein